MPSSVTALEGSFDFFSQPEVELIEDVSVRNRVITVKVLKLWFSQAVSICTEVLDKAV